MRRLHTLQVPRWVDALWLLLLTSYIVAGVTLVPLHGDEPTLIYMGRDFYDLTPDNLDALRYDDWQELSPEAATRQDLRLLNGTLLPYLYGATAAASGYAVDDINQQWVWGAGWAWNHANGHVPARDLLLRTRLVSAVLTAIGAWALFGSGQALHGRGVAYIASGIYALHPAILLNGRRAMMEGGLLGLSLLVVLAGIWVVQHRAWWTYALLGVCSGFAVASKHTGAVIVAAVFAGAGLYFLRNGTHRTRQIAALSAAGVLSLMVFYALTPAWWNAPLARADEVLTMRSAFLQNQQNAFPSYENVGDNLRGFVVHGLAVPPQYAETPIDDFVANQVDVIAMYEQSLLNGVHPGAIGGTLLAMLALAGSIALWRDTDVSTEARFVVSAWSITVLLLTLVITPLPWQRYYLPLYPALAVLAALGAVYLLEHTASQRSPDA